jgi:hypothetical protein
VTVGRDLRPWLEPVLAGQPVAWDWDGFAESQAHYADLGLALAVTAS